MWRKYYFPVALSVLLVQACTHPADPVCSLTTYRQQQSANVSTVLWPVGEARQSLQDLYAPDFRWKRADGTLDSLSGHRGQVVFLNFWASWCGPCTAEMPTVQNIADEMGDSLFVIGVAVDECNDPFATVSDYIRNNNYRYQIAVDSLWRLYMQYWLWQTNALPQSFFIGPDGQIKLPAVTGEENKSTLLYYIRRAEQ